LEDPDVAHVVDGTDEFKAYIEGMLWAQDYALENRSQMMKAVAQVIAGVIYGLPTRDRDPGGLRGRGAAIKKADSSNAVATMRVVKNVTVLRCGLLTRVH
jgi:hypothetical protein